MSGFVGGELAYRVLRRWWPAGTTYMGGDAYAQKSKLETLLGGGVWAAIRGRTVLDFGCGEGHEAVELAQRGAARVFGIDIQEHFLQRARDHACAAGVADRCTFSTEPPEKAEVIVSLDSFEHFGDPGAVLDVMAGMLAPEGRVLVSFGPTWYHPLGGHLFSVFPWAHLVFTERALMRWRSDFKDDGATRFGEVAGGLNQMTIARFERLVAASRLRFARFEPVPIRRIAPLHSTVTREFTTAIVRCELVHR